MYDLSIIGAGWAGFNAALKAKAAGLKVALIEQKELGGTCLNRGCIPTKTLIHSAKVYAQSKKASRFGLEALEPKINFPQIQERKEKIVQQLRQGMQSLLGGIDLITGQAQILSSQDLKVGSLTIKSKFILVASGAKPIELPQFKFDGKKILTSDDILNLREIPASILIIGGGVIGCEFASLFSTFGSKVTVVEKLAQLLPGEDREVAKKLENIFKKKNILVYVNTDAVSMDLEDYEIVLVCVGRAADIQGLGLDKAGVNLEKGKIVVDEYLRTNIPSIFAAGDCSGKIMLAHYAAYQGNIAAENIIHPENLQKVDNTNIPSCIFTDPEIASIGLTEEQAINKGLEVAVNKFDFLGSGMARIIDETEGFIKISSDKNSGIILGANIIAAKATELIGILCLAISNRLKVAQIRDTVFAHPTLSESISETLKN